MLIIFLNTHLSIVGLEGLCDLQPLDNAAAAEHVDDGLLVGAKALHRLAQGLSVRRGVKRLRGVHRGGALHTKENYFFKH